MRPDPKFLVLILGNWENWVAAQAGGIAFFAPENLKRIPVKTVQSVAAGDPDEAFLILDNVPGGIAGKAVRNFVAFEIIRRFLTQTSQT